LGELLTMSLTVIFHPEIKRKDYILHKENDTFYCAINYLFYYLHILMGILATGILHFNGNHVFYFCIYW